MTERARSSGSPGDPTAGRPLAGVRVVEFGHVAAGPFASMVLADMGADVVKVESPNGDDMRQWPPIAESDGERFSHNFASVNRGKRSLVADLKDPRQLRQVLRLVQAADVVIQNYRPGVLDRLGLGFAETSLGHRGLIYCSLSGFGEASPYRERGAFDVVVQGMSGLMSVTGQPDGDPVKAGVPMGDFVAGLYAAVTIAAHLPYTRSAGISVHLDCPMLDCLLAVSALQTSEYWGTGRPPGRLGSAHPRNAPYQAFRAADGLFTMAAGNDRLWRAVCDVVGADSLRDDERFADQLGRVRHQRELAAALEDRLTQQPVAHWLAAFNARGVPCGPIYDFAQILADDHVKSTGLVTTMDVPVIGPTPTVVYPVRVGGHNWQTGGPPRLGADNVTVRADWGVDT